MQQLRHDDLRINPRFGNRLRHKYELKAKIRSSAIVHPELAIQIGVWETRRWELARIYRSLQNV